jgi:WD40 repeat protein
VSDTQQVLLTTGISRDAYVWSISPVKRIFKLGGHYNQLVDATDCGLSTGQMYYITLTNRKEFRMWDAVNYRLVREFSDPNPQIPENSYSALFFDHQQHCLITASSVPARWAENEVLMGNFLETTTHHLPIVGCFYARPFDQIVTVDTLSNIKVWDCDTGAIASCRRTEWTPTSSQLSAATLDASCRRLITTSLDTRNVIWNYNSGAIITTTAIPEANGIVSTQTYDVIGGRSLLIRGGWDKAVSLFAESAPNEFILYRKYLGHTDDISALASYAGGLTSGSVNGQIFSWFLDTSLAQASYTLGDGKGVECLHCMGYILFAGGGDGILHVFSLPKLGLIHSIAAHGILASHALSAMASDDAHGFLFTADTLGYVKKWKVRMEHLCYLEGVGIWRCAHDEITTIISIRDGRFLVLAGVDMNVRLWDAQTFQCVGMLYEQHVWNLNDPQTWLGESPFEVGSDHFSDRTGLPISTSRQSGGSMKLTDLGATALQASPVFTLESAREEPEPHPFSFDEATKVIQDMIDTLGKPQEMPSALIPELLSSQPRVQHPELQGTIRPMELVAKIHGMWNRPRTTEATTHGKRPLRMPIVTPKSQTRRAAQARKQTWTRLLL